MPRRICMSQSLTGPLANWTWRDWYRATKWWHLNGIKPSWRQLKSAVQELVDQGHEVIPYGECDNFDKVRGCLGHEYEAISDEKTTLARKKHL